MPVVAWLRKPVHADITVAAVLFVTTLVTTVTPPSQVRIPGLTVLFAGIACGSLAVRRRWPLPVLLASAVAAEMYLALYPHHEGVLILAAPLLALYSVADSTSRGSASFIGALAVGALAGVHVVAGPDSWLGSDNVALAAFGAVAVAAGHASRVRRAYTAEVEQRARRAELDREREAWRRVTEERLRIARDLHDALGHQLALINVQAGVADHLLDERPDQTRRALAHVRQASRTALGELRDTIGLLREPDESPTPTEPTASLSGLDELVASFRRSGVRVDTDVEGPVRPLAPAADLTAYRVVQESLTNACKHAAGAAVRLRLTYRPDALRVRVDNEAGTPSTVDGAGHGLAGMRERVAAVGGALRAGPRPGGGFRVDATLPAPGTGTGTGTAR
jgi:signal transduction histidine kinase